MRLGRLALALLALPLVGATYLTTDPTNGANGNGYCDTCLVNYRGAGLSSTYFTGNLTFTKRKFVRLSNLTINGSVSIDSASSNIVLDSVRVNGSFSCSGDSSRFSNSTLIGTGISLRNGTQSSAVADTSRPEGWLERDTLSNLRLILTPGKGGTAWVAQSFRLGYVSAVNCSIYCSAGQGAAAFKSFLSDRNQYLDTSWRIRNDDNVGNEESGYWCLRDLSSWNTFTRDTVWQTGIQPTNINLNHAGNCGPDFNYCGKQMGNRFESCAFLALSSGDAGMAKIFTQCRLEGESYTNCLFAAHGCAFDMRPSGTARTYQSGRTRFRFNTFVSFSEEAFKAAQDADAYNNLTMTDNIFYSRRTEPDPMNMGVYHGTVLWETRALSALTSADTVDYNLHFWNVQYDAPIAPIAYQRSGSGAYRSMPGAGNLFHQDTGLEAHGHFGSPQFKDSSYTYRFDDEPRTGSYAVGGRWRNGYVGRKTVADSLPDSTASITVAYNGTLAYLQWLVPHDNTGVIGYRLYRSSTPVTSTASASLVATGDVTGGQGSSMTVPIGQHQLNVQWYYYVRFEDEKGQLGPHTQASVKVTSGPSWWWSPVD